MTEQCPKCSSNFIYQDGPIWICPECFHEWNDATPEKTTDSESNIFTDAYGTVLNDGDTVTLIKELKIKGSTSAIKIGTKVKNIKLGDFSAGHDISCKIEGFGAMNLKTQFVKKV